MEPIKFLEKKVKAKEFIDQSEQNVYKRHFEHVRNQ